jgi:hypothetical protein
VTRDRFRARAPTAHEQSGNARGGSRPDTASVCLWLPASESRSVKDFHRRARTQVELEFQCDAHRDGHAILGAGCELELLRHLRSRRCPRTRRKASRQIANLPRQRGPLSTLAMGRRPPLIRAASSASRTECHLQSPRRSVRDRTRRSEAPTRRSIRSPSPVGHSREQARQHHVSSTTSARIVV